MIANTEFPRTIHDQLANRFQVEGDEQRVVVHTPFSYSDGDGYSLVVLNNGNGTATITDEGDVVNHASYSGVDLLSRKRIERLKKVNLLYGIDERDGELSMHSPIDSIGESLTTFAQACFEISRLTKLRPARDLISRSQAFRRSVTTELIEIIYDVQPNAKAEFNWHHPVFDPHNVYAVDILVEFAVPAMLFVIATEHDCWRKTTTCLHYRQNNVAFDGIGIVNDDIEEGPSVIAFQDTNSTAFRSTEKLAIRERLRKLKVG